MAKVTISIETGNAACETFRDVGALVEEAGARLSSLDTGEPITVNHGWAIMDENGNSVGRVRIDK